MVNRIVLVGRMAVDPELKFTPSGVAVTTFRIAVDRPFNNAQGEKEADFINIVAWRQNAEFAANYLTKGSVVAVDGRLQIRNYTDRDNNRRSIAEVVCDHVRGIGGRSQKEGGAEGGAVGGPADGPAGYEDDPFQDQ